MSRGGKSPLEHGCTLAFPKKSAELARKGEMKKGGGGEKKMTFIFIGREVGAGFAQGEVVMHQ